MRGEWSVERQSVGASNQRSTLHALTLRRVQGSVEGRASERGSVGPTLHAPPRSDALTFRRVQGLDTGCLQVRQEICRRSSPSAWTASQWLKRKNRQAITRRE